MTYESLSDAELRLVRGLRDIAPGAAHEELMSLIEDLVKFVTDPRCSRSQPDGVPCLSVGKSCEECQCVADTISRLHGILHQLN
jgi:hypothetical protein